MLDLKFKFSGGHEDGRDWMARPALRVVFWNVTSACNLRCGICFADAGRPTEGELGTVEAKAMLRAAAAAGVKDIVLSGGEPMMRRDILELLGFIGELGLGARMASNGVLLNGDVLRALRAETPLRSFMISVDSMDPAVYRTMHGASDGDLANVLRSVSTIRDLGFHTTVAARVTPLTLPGLPALLEKASAEGWHTLTLMLPVHTGRTAGAGRRDDDVLSLLGSVFDRFVGLPRHWLIETCIPWARFHPVIKEVAARVRVSHAGCGAGRSFLVVQPSGWVHPCLCMNTIECRIGNVRVRSLDEMFRDSPVCTMLRDPRSHGICDDCDDVALCGGGCRASALAATGHVNGKDMSCPKRRHA